MNLATPIEELGKTPVARHRHRRHPGTKKRKISPKVARTIVTNSVKPREFVIKRSFSQEASPCSVLPSGTDQNVPLLSSGKLDNAVNIGISTGYRDRLAGDDGVVEASAATADQAS